MRVIPAAIILALSLPAVTAAASAAPDRCAAQEKALRTEAVEACSGMSYLFNPSGCFIARKALKAFDAAACRAAAAPEQAAPEPPQTIPAAAPEPPKTLPTAVPEPPQTIPAAVPPPHCDMPKKAPHGAAAPEPDPAELKAENARLKAEIVRLRAEMEQLKGGRGADR